MTRRNTEFFREWGWYQELNQDTSYMLGKHYTTVIYFHPPPIYFETEAPRVVQAGLEPAIFLPQYPEQLGLQACAIGPASTENSWYCATTRYDTVLWIQVIIHLHKPNECTIPKMSSKVNYKLWMIMMYHCGVIKCNKCTTLVA